MAEKKRKSPDRCLVLVDDSKASEKALHYVADLARELANGNLAAPPCSTSRGGMSSPCNRVTSPGEEAKRERELARERKGWIEDASTGAEPLFDRARAILKHAGVPDDRLEKRTFAEASDELAGEALRIASEMGCGTIVVGRSALPWYGELTHRHLADELIERGDGFAVVVAA